MTTKLLTNRVLDQFDIQHVADELQHLHNLVLEEDKEQVIPITYAELVDILDYCKQNLHNLFEYRQQAELYRKSGTYIDLVSRYWNIAEQYMSLANAANVIAELNGRI